VAPLTEDRIATMAVALDRLQPEKLDIRVERWLRVRDFPASPGGNPGLDLAL
jgi:hypothetical protein